MKDKKEKVCSYCKGTRFLNTGYKEVVENGKRILYPYTHPCYCEINKQINKRFDILSRYPVIPPEDSNKVHKRYQGKNVIFSGKEDKFLYLVKSYFMKGFVHKDYMILEGRDIVDRYNVPKEDGTWLTVTYLNQYDILVILFTSNIGYPTLKNCVADVIKNRYRVGVPTWVYSYDSSTLMDSKEYSSSLKPYFEEYTRATIDASTFDYKGFSTLNTGVTQTARKTQERLGDI